MLSFTFEQVKTYGIGIAILMVIYIIIYKYKGINQNLNGYISAIKSCIFYGVCGVFIIVGVGVLKQLIIQKSNYLAAIIPIGWFVLCLFIIKSCILNDFGIEIYKFNIMGFIMRIIFSILYKYVPIFFAVLCFLAAYDSRSNIFQVIALIIVGVICLGISILVFKISNLFKFDRDEKKKEDKEKK